MFSSIVIIILLFSFVPYTPPEPYKLKKEIVTMVEEISAVMDKYEEPPPEERPKVAVEAESEVAEEDIVETIAATEFQEDLIRTKPTGPEIEIVPFYKLEIVPKLKYLPKPKYPELARKAGIEGQTVVKALVDIDGSIMDVKVLKSSGNTMLDESALIAARRAKFTPAKQRDRFVRCWVTIPVRFRLTGG
jgi:protein TonB